MMSVKCLLENLLRLTRVLVISLTLLLVSGCPALAQECKHFTDSSGVVDNVLIVDGELMFLSTEQEVRNNSKKLLKFDLQVDEITLLNSKIVILDQKVELKDSLLSDLKEERKINQKIVFHALGHQPKVAWYKDPSLNQFVGASLTVAMFFLWKYADGVAKE